MAVVYVLSIEEVVEDRGTSSAGGDQPFSSGTRASLEGIEAIGRPYVDIMAERPDWVEANVPLLVRTPESVEVQDTTEVLILTAEDVGSDDDVDVLFRAVDVVVGTVSAGGVSSLTTTYFSCGGRDAVFVISCVTIISTVLAGSRSVTICVATIVSIEGGTVIAAAVTVTVSSEV